MPPRPHEEAMNIGRCPPVYNTQSHLLVLCCHSLKKQPQLTGVSLAEHLLCAGT